MIVGHLHISTPEDKQHIFLKKMSEIHFLIHGFISFGSLNLPWKWPVLG